jgi:hypothetical protein
MAFVLYYNGIYSFVLVVREPWIFYYSSILYFECCHSSGGGFLLLFFVNFCRRCVFIHLLHLFPALFVFGVLGP